MQLINSALAPVPFSVTLPVDGYHQAGFGWKNEQSVARTAPGGQKLVPPAGFEPTAPGLGILCSIHLS